MKTTAINPVALNQQQNTCEFQMKANNYRLRISKQPFSDSHEEMAFAWYIRPPT